MNCCQSCYEFCCPCLVSSKSKRSSKWAYVQYKPIPKTSSGGLSAAQQVPLSKIPVPGDAEPPAIPQPKQVFEFPQKKSELPEHPQMFVGSSMSLGRDHVVTEQPRPGELNIGTRRFSSLPRSTSQESDHDTLVRGRTRSLPQRTLVKKPNRKGRTKSQGLAWGRSHSLKDEGSHLEAFTGTGDSLKPETAGIHRTGRSLPDLRKGTRSLLKRRNTIDSDMVGGTNYSAQIPGLPVLEEESLTKDSNRPLIQFSLQYDVMKCSLTVHLHHARNLPAKDKRGTSDPFVVLYMMPNKEEIFESMVILQSLNPVFDESFEFKKLSAEDIRRQSLTLRVYDHDKFSKNDTIGGVVLPLENADLFGVVMRMEVDENPSLFSQVS